MDNLSHILLYILYFIVIINELNFNCTFISSTKEGKPPTAIKVKNAATNIDIVPLA